MASLRLIGEIKMPAIGYGTWQVPADDAPKLVETALDVGYRHIDCAHVYNNEHKIGELFGKRKDRKDLYITSKLWCDSHEPSKVLAACKKTLENLQLEYLDMYLIHNPVRTTESFSSPQWFRKDAIVETWREMVKLQETGLCKAVGVSNFTTKKLEWIIEGGHIPSNNQVELHPYLPQDKLLKFCNEHKIVLTAYSPLGTPATPKSLPTLFPDDKAVLLEDPVIGEIAKKNNLTTAQVLLAWGVKRNTPVLAKSSSKERMIENLKGASFPLSDEDFYKINSITTRIRYLDFKFFCPEGHTVEEFWDGEYQN